jgi:hypothetical protein
VSSLNDIFHQKTEFISTFSSEKKDFKQLSAREKKCGSNGKTKQKEKEFNELFFTGIECQFSFVCFLRLISSRKTSLLLFLPMTFDKQWEANEWSCGEFI